jgi:hypothetical protein
MRFIVIILVLLGADVRAQLVDTLKVDFSSKPKLYAAFDTRNSFITHNLAKIRGVRLGVSYNKRTRVGISFNWLDTDFTREHQVIYPDSTYTYPARLNFWFVSPFIEHSFWKLKHLEVEIPVRLGIGASGFKFTDRFGKDLRFYNQPVLVYEPGMVITYRFLKYLGLSAGFGFRLMLIPNRSLPERFTSPVYSLGIRTYLGDLWNDIKPKKKAE